MLSRRHFLKLAGVALSSAAIAPLSENLPVLAAAPRTASLPPNPAPESIDADPLATLTTPPTPFGRVTMFGVDVFSQPRRNAEIVRTARRDEVLVLRGQIKGDALRPHNNVWYETAEGFVYSSIVQPVLDQKNVPLPDLAKQAFWGDITVPFADTRWTPDPAGRASSRLYFGSVYRVIDASPDASGDWWYQLREGVAHSPGPWVRAEHLRRFDPVVDLSPIAPAVADKRIEINIAQQTLTAFESDKPVLFTRVSTGFGKNFTPRGNYNVFRKAVGQRMIGGEGNDHYDLPGVPFPTYFTYRGIAFHGTYWHNDYGVVRSHGCINVPSDIARWIWRWTTPVAPLEAADIRFRPGLGTPVKVI